MTAHTAADGPTMARSIEATVLANAEAAERQRTLNGAIVEALWKSGLMLFMNPREAGGREPSIRELIDTWVELARQDGSVGWIGIANFPSAAFAAAYLPDEGFDEVFTRNGNQVTLGGQFAPNGLGNSVDGGYRVTGNWQFGSGTGHAEYVVGGFIPMDDGNMRMADAVMPEMMVAVFRREEIVFTDGWHVTGLKGTGSFDYHVEDVFVPECRSFRLFTREPLRGGPLYRFGVMPLTASGHAGWALGVARSALDDIVALAQSKTRMGDPTTLAHKLTFQRDLAHHEGMWRAAYRLVVDTFNEVERQLGDGDQISVQMRVDMRLAATYATNACREIVEFAHLAAGTAAIREGSRLERAFRDIYTGTQHTFINEKTYTDAAQVMLGLIDDSPGL